jgi:GTP pyrophosphokinase/guanosine-3',5'-bis(diphosphate) 3'-pyrophosphohydrolase
MTYTVFGAPNGAYETIYSSTSLEHCLNFCIERWNESETDCHVCNVNGLLFKSADILRNTEAVNAFYLARKYHSGQIRKGDGLEYLIHLLEISYLLIEYDSSERIISASFCHDLLEDTECLESEIESVCGSDVLQIVKAVSNDSKLNGRENWWKKKQSYIKSVQAGGAEAIVVCLADKIVNMRSLIKVYEEEGASIWSKFNASVTEKIEFEKMVLEMARENICHPLLSVYEYLIKRVQKKIIR